MRRLQHPARALLLDRLDQGQAGLQFGDNRVPTGSFDDPEAMAEAGWVNIDYQIDGITAKMADHAARRTDGDGSSTG